MPHIRNMCPKTGRRLTHHKHPCMCVGTATRPSSNLTYILGLAGIYITADLRYLVIFHFHYSLLYVASQLSSPAGYAALQLPHMHNNHPHSQRSAKLPPGKGSKYGTCAVVCSNIFSPSSYGNLPSLPRVSLCFAVSGKCAVLQICLGLLVARLHSIRLIPC